MGDHIEVAIGGHALPFTISGITGYGGTDSLAGGSMAIFSLPGPLAAVAGAPLTRLPARVGALARGNTVRNPGRTSATAAALMVGLPVVTAVSVLVGSARSMISGQVTAAGKARFYVQATNADTGLTPGLAAVLARQPGVRAVTEVRTTDATVAGCASAGSSPGPGCSPTTC